MTFPWADGSDIAMMPVDYEGTWAQYVAEDSVADPEDVGLSDADAARVLSGDITPLGLTAAGGEPHTGAMIALLPSEADMERLAVPGGEDDEELHITLC